jgi:hypothetical protein
LQNLPAKRILSTSYLYDHFLSVKYLFESSGECRCDLTAGQIGARIGRGTELRNPEADPGQVKMLRSTSRDTSSSRQIALIG